MSKRKDFLIERNGRALLVQVVSVIAAADMTFLLSILLLIGFRNVAGLDVTLVGLFVVSFIIKTVVEIVMISKNSKEWFEEQYIVRGENLVVLKG